MYNSRHRALLVGGDRFELLAKFAVNPRADGFETFFAGSHNSIDVDLSLRGISNCTSAKLRSVDRTPVKKTISTQRRFMQELARSVRFPKSKLRSGHPSHTIVGSG